MRLITRLAAFVIVLLLVACSSSMQQTFKPKDSFLQNSNTVTKISSSESPDQNETLVNNDNDNVNSLPSFKSDVKNQNKVVDLTLNFSDSKMVKITTDELPLKDFLHHVLGDLLDINYILGEDIQKDNKNITLNIREEVSKRKLFTLSEKLLEQRGYVIRFDDQIYYIHKIEGNGYQGDIAYGYGNLIENVPNTSLNIVQMVPLSFGMQTSLANTLKQLTNVQANPDFERNAILIQGKRRDILRSLEFINLMDQPQFQNRHIGSYQTDFISIQELTESLPKLLKQEGLSLSISEKNDKAISIVPLERLSTIIIFANQASLVERVVFWAEKLDKPALGSELQYFVYHPEYSRASDLGDSIMRLVSGQSQPTLSNNTSAVQQNNQTQNESKTLSGVSPSGNLSLVVDERSNSLIFKTTGGQYRKLHPLIKRLDVLPKQVILEVIIAEVSLTDEFKQGVEFALNNGNYGLSNLGAFMGEGGFGGLSYLLSGDIGKLAINLFQTNSLVNIVSRPSLVVRDGVKASISVGTDIPVIGETSNDPINGDRQTTSIDYRKTGVELDVVPTVNARGYVIMEINQKISNEVDGTTIAGSNPSIFERSISTEVIAESGQTIILGGLISENKSNSDTKVPFFADIPLIGNLFRADTKKVDKTELVVMVTPRIIESAEEWQDIKAKFSSELKKLTLY